MQVSFMTTSNVICSRQTWELFVNKCNQLHMHYHTYLDKTITVWMKGACWSTWSITYHFLLMNICNMPTLCSMWNWCNASRNWTWCSACIPKTKHNYAIATWYLHFGQRHSCSHNSLYCNKLFKYHTERFTDYDSTHAHACAHLTALCTGLHGLAGTRKVKPMLTFLKQETVSGSVIRWTTCNSAVTLHLALDR